MLFHPKRYYRLLSQRFMALRLLVRCKRHRVELQMGSGIIIRHCKVIGKGGSLSIGDNCRIDSVRFTFSGYNSRITIGRKCHLNNSHLGVYGPYRIIEVHNKVSLKCAALGVHGDHGVIVLHNNVIINANPDKRTALCVSAGHKITIMDYSQLSNAINLSTTDFHSIYNDSGERINNDKDIYIGEHVWIGERCYICKGVSIANDNVVGACSVVTKSFEESNVIIAGNPATVKKRQVKWIR